MSVQPGASPPGGGRGAFQELLILEERVRMSGASLPRRADFREKVAGVSVSIGAHVFLIPIVEIAEILEKRRPTVIPGCMFWMKGILNLRGRLLPVYGASEFFAGAEANVAAQADALDILVVDRGALFCGIAVDAIHGMEKFHREGLRVLDGDGRALLGPLAGLADSVTEFGDKPAYRLDIAAMARALGEADPWRGRGGTR